MSMLDVHSQVLVKMCGSFLSTVPVITLILLHLLVIGYNK